jgi:uncharacterized damage-inducible protein DinB
MQGRNPVTDAQRDDNALSVADLILAYEKGVEELDFVAATRRQVARTLSLVAPDAWKRTAVHSETGLVTLRQLLLHAINHLRHHLRFVAEKRAAMR